MTRHRLHDIRRKIRCALAGLLGGFAIACSSTGEAPRTPRPEPAQPFPGGPDPSSPAPEVPGPTFPPMDAGAPGAPAPITTPMFYGAGPPDAGVARDAAAGQ